MADHVVAYACGFETGSLLEAHHIDGGALFSAPAACFSLVTPSGALMQGGYMLQIDYSAGIGSLTRNLSMGAMQSAGGLGFDIEFLANAANADNHIIGVDSNSLSGWFLQRRVSDQKLIIAAYDGTEVAIVSANAYTSGQYHIQVRRETGAVLMRIYDSSLSLVEDLYSTSPPGAGSSHNTLRIGQVAGSPTAGKYYLDNIYVIRGGGAWPPLHPTFEAHSVNADSVNDTGIFTSAAGADATPNEYQMIDEIPPVRTDYLYKNASDLASRTQLYAHAGFGLGTPEFITVGVVNLWERVNTTGTQVVASQIRLSATTLTHPSSGQTVALAPGARYEAPAFWTEKPGGGDWAAADVDNALPGHRFFRFGGSATDLRAHQILMYVIYGDDAELITLTGMQNPIVG